MCPYPGADHTLGRAQDQVNEECILFFILLFFLFTTGQFLISFRDQGKGWVGGGGEREREREGERGIAHCTHPDRGLYTHTPGIKTPTFSHNTMLQSTEPNSPILGTNCQQTCDRAEVTL